MSRWLLTCLIFIAFQTNAQKQHYHWVFGDSVGINFNASPPGIDTTHIISAWQPSASISDAVGNLLFYVGSSELNFINPGSFQYTVRNRVDSIMPGGDSLLGSNGATQGIIIIPFPGNTDKYYIFHGSPNHYYSIVDMSLNNGLGAVSARNVFLEDSTKDKMHAVKAANGRDWWLLIGRGFISNTSISKYKIDTAGIHHKGYQFVNTIFYSHNGGQMKFSPQGDQLAFAGGGSNSRLYSFDRCTGNIFNETLLHSYVQNTWEYGCSFSPSGRYIYLSTHDTLWRFDTQAANVASSQQLIFAMPDTLFVLGQHQLAPDGKIYIANSYYYGINIPTDSLNTHLSVINSPDSINADFTPFSFSLKGRKSYLSLPHMPNYNLGLLANINCDSILSINESESNPFTVYPNPGSGKFNIQLIKQAEKTTVEVFTLLGSNIFKHQVKTEGSSFDLDLTSLPEGIYLLQLTDDAGKMGSRKVVILK